MKEEAYFKEESHEKIFEEESCEKVFEENLPPFLQKSKRGRKVKYEEAERMLIEWMKASGRTDFTKKELIEKYKESVSNSMMIDDSNGRRFCRHTLDRILKRNNMT